jgi:hypothetical protein
VIQVNPQSAQIGGTQMTALLIIYDLNAQGQNYECITKTIEKTFETRWRFQKSAWLVHTAMSEYDAAMLLSSCLDTNDTLFVTRPSATSAWSGYDKVGTDWIASVL